MNDIVKVLGQRIRNYRTNNKLSQERLAELSGCHPTYIGQVERGEKNATIESISKICVALNVPLSQLFENVDININEDNIPLKCYELVLSKPKTQQQHLYRLLLEMDNYKNN